MISTSRANPAPADNLGSVVGTGNYRLTCGADPFPHNVRARRTRRRTEVRRSTLKRAPHLRGCVWKYPGEIVFQEKKARRQGFHAQLSLGVSIHCSTPFGSAPRVSKSIRTSPAL